MLNLSNDERPAPAVAAPSYYEAEIMALQRCDQQMTALQKTHSEWYELFEDALPDSACRADLVELLASAPNAFALGLLYGKYTMRLEIEALTGRPFQ